MEDQQNAQQQLQQKQQNSEGWREGHDKVAGCFEPTAAEIRMSKILGPHEHAKYSRNCVNKKELVLGDLRKLFTKKSDSPQLRPSYLSRIINGKNRRCTRTISSAGCRLLRDMQKSDQMSDLVMLIQSPHFKITEKGNLTKTNGLLSADKTDALTNGPLVREVENGSILCDSHQVSGSVDHTVPIMDASEQTLSMDQI